MKKAILAVSLGISSIALGAAFIKARLSRKQEHDNLVETLLDYESQLEEYIDLINASSSDRPDEIMFAADRTLDEAVEDGMEFTTAMFMPCLSMSEGEINEMSDETIRTHISYIRAILPIARKHFETIDAARENSKKARKQLDGENE